MLRYLFSLSLIFSLHAVADVLLSSPKIKLNAQDQRVIDFRIENERIKDGDITLNEYKSNNPINDSFIAYTLISDFGDYQTFTIVLDDKYKEEFVNKGITCIKWDLKPHSVNPIKELFSLIHIWKIIKKELNQNIHIICILLWTDSLMIWASFGHHLGIIWGCFGVVLRLF